MTVLEAASVGSGARVLAHGVVIPAAVCVTAARIARVQPLIKARPSTATLAAIPVQLDTSTGPPRALGNPRSTSVAATTTNNSPLSTHNQSLRACAEAGEVLRTVVGGAPIDELASPLAGICTTSDDTDPQLPAAERNDPSAVSAKA
jgi:hypothetical protein